MMTARRIATTLLLLPLAEVVVFVAVALAVGFWQAVLLAMVTSVVGALLLRLAGQTHLRRFRDAPGIAITADASGRGLVMALAGILLLVPGFITDLAGILLLVRTDGTFERTVTDGDIRRLLLAGATLDDRLDRLAQIQSLVLHEGYTRQSALELMSTHGIDHLPVLDKRGVAVRVVERRELDEQILLSTPHLGEAEREFVEEAFRTKARVKPFEGAALVVTRMVYLSD